MDAVYYGPLKEFVEMHMLLGDYTVNVCAISPHGKSHLPWTVGRFSMLNDCTLLFAQSPSSTAAGFWNYARAMPESKLYQQRKTGVDLRIHISLRMILNSTRTANVKRSVLSHF